ncbi:sigma-54 dependent transcriptional regulator [Colwellia sp. D2M02]|uniref:sigma-54-dependent transcriptional regulator n=1 Tax=Colwellia sp. D2M02 TaxID=2841562 RepID=UPI001C0812AC|nr:sigma-54 dependent transcriptional regulator [Colwellia sp. D2M02]MBU2893647.1 sigma-54 dependent transcriptional regulator [Colwellia sp. D2M02]
MNDNLPVVVLVDDEVEILNALKRVIRKFECNLVIFSDPTEALSFIQDNEVTIICSDQRMPKLSGRELLEATMVAWPSSQRIMLSAYQDFDNIAQGFNDGTIQRFIAKPWNNKELEAVFTQVLGVSDNSSSKPFGNMIGMSEAMLELFRLIKAAAGANVPIFIHGETGTGKELVAQACHTYSHRAAEPFVALNCANLSEHLIESQLFGHKKGAFTGAIKDQSGYFAHAAGGTIFLDEITTLPLNLQAKLLRVIQEREYLPVGASRPLPFDVQVVSASSTSLSDAVEKREFREDLYYRLAVIQLKIPKLSDRGDDVVVIAQHFLTKYASLHSKDFIGLADDAISYIKSFSWPGNVRQLENLLHGVIILNQGKLITKAMLLKNMDEHLYQLVSIQETDLAPLLTSVTTDDIKPLAEVEKQLILSAIAKCDGNIVQASKLLEINPSTIYRKMSKW